MRTVPKLVHQNRRKSTTDVFFYKFVSIGIKSVVMSIEIYPTSGNLRKLFTESVDVKRKFDYGRGNAVMTLLCNRPVLSA